jgi:outer membrane cobalamin receptor
LEGASPLIVNFDLSHRYAKKQLNLTNSLVFNYFSDRIHTIGAQGYKNIMENGVPTLDFVSSSKINEYFTLKLKAANLLNSTYQLTRENSDGSRNEILTQYKKGINISLGLVYEL